MKKTTKKQKWGIIIGSIFLIGIIGSIFTPSGEIEKTYKTYKTETTITTPATPAKEAVYEEPKTYTLSQGNWIVGEDLPEGKYDVKFKNNGSNCAYYVNGRLKLNDIANGSNCSLANQNFKNGDEIEIKYGTGDFVGGAELITPATSEIPEISIDYTMIYDDLGLEICTINETEADDCTSIAAYDTLISQKDNSKIETESVEKLKINGDDETCYIDNITKDCSQLHLYDQLKKEIIVE